MTELRRRRLAAGLKPWELGKMANIYLPNLSKYELARDKAGPGVRGRLASALGADEAELFTQDGWPLMAEATVTP